MSFIEATTQWLSTREAGTLVGRSPHAVKNALGNGSLQGHREEVGGRLVWRVTREAVVSWDAQTIRGRGRPYRRPHECAARLLEEYGTLSAHELACVAGIHAGNARKHLAILAAEGRATRLPDGQWVLTTGDREQVSA